MSRQFPARNSKDNFIVETYQSKVHDLHNYEDGKLNYITVRKGSCTFVSEMSLYSLLA